MPKKSSSSKKTTGKKKTHATRKWSASVTKHSNALDLERGVFKSDDPKKIADSLKKSAGKSKRKKGTPYQSAMSMLNFYENRAGKNLPGEQKKTLEQAKDELRKDFGRDENGKKKTQKKGCSKKMSTKKAGYHLIARSPQPV